MKVQQAKKLQQKKESFQQHKIIAPVNKADSVRTGELEKGLGRE